MPDGLTDKQKAFIDQYFLCGFNGTEAARRAGYQGNDNVLGVTAYDLLRNPNIKPYIDQRMVELHISANEILGRLADHATGSMVDFFDIGPRGSVKLNLAKAAKAGKLHLIHSYSKGRGGVVRIEMYDAQAAMVIVGKHHKLFTEKMEHSGKVDLIEMTMDEWKAQQGKRKAQVTEDLAAFEEKVEGEDV